MDYIIKIASGDENPVFSLTPDILQDTTVVVVVFLYSWLFDFATEFTAHF